MNIYDFAGNEWEWTLEYTTYYTSDPCDRGGYYYSDGLEYPASRRYNVDTTGSYDSVNLRAALY